MLNNKGFAVSAVLYTLLIAFLMFLGAALAMFSSSSSLIGKANNDLINGSDFDVIQVKTYENGKECGTNKDYMWYQATDGVTLSNTIIQIKNKYGTKYWPRDFEGNDITVEIDDTVKLESGVISGKIRVEYNVNPEVNYENYGQLTFIDDDGNREEVILKDICY